MIVKLVEHTKLSNVVLGGRTCWDSFHKGGYYDLPTDDINPEDKHFLNRIINKHKHGSVSEHGVYTFDVKGISRACLQELARHRIASYSVRSTRYTLGDLKNEKPFEGVEGVVNSQKYIVLTDESVVNACNIQALENLRKILSLGISNDKAKYCLPEAFKTNLIMTINMRSLQNFLSLRSDKSALWEIRELSKEVYKAIPAEHKFLFEGHMKCDIW